MGDPGKTSPLQMPGPVLVPAALQAGPSLAWEPLSPDSSCARPHEAWCRPAEWPAPSQATVFALAWGWGWGGSRHVRLLPWEQNVRAWSQCQQAADWPGEPSPCPAIRCLGGGAPPLWGCGPRLQPSEGLPAE